MDLRIRYKNLSNATEIFAEARPEYLRGNFFKTEVKVLDKENNLLAQAQVKSFLPQWNGKNE